MGGLLAGALSRAGHEVVCLAGESTVDVLRAKGIQVSSELFGEFTAPVDADTRLRTPVDVCFIAVKHTALEAALERVEPSALGDALLVPLLNGVEHPALLRERYRPELVAPAAIRVEATRLEPGVIAHPSPFADIALASSTTPRPRLEETARMLVEAGFTARVVEDEAASLWSKMGLLAPMALLTTRYMQPVGEIRAQHGGELSAAIREVSAVAAAVGVTLDVDAIEGLFRNVPGAMKSSMQRDAEAGRALELDAIGGAALRAAALQGVAVPVLTELVLALASR